MRTGMRLVVRGAVILGLLGLTILTSVQVNSRVGAPAVAPAALAASDNDNASNGNVSPADIVNGDVALDDLVDSDDTVHEVMENIVEEDAQNLNSADRKELHQAKRAIHRQIRVERKEDRQNANSE